MGRRTLKVCVDTNVLVRAVVRDDEDQAAAADQLLLSASILAVTLPCLCEFVWVLRTAYEFSPQEVASIIRLLYATQNVVMDRAAVDAGLKMLDASGDFADGVIAHQGAWLGAEVFASFDKQAVKLLSAQGVASTLLS